MIDWPLFLLLLAFCGIAGLIVLIIWPVEPRRKSRNHLTPVFPPRRKDE